jgi:ketosteroid isomerase-like protein
MDRDPLEYFRWFYAPDVNSLDRGEVAERWHRDLVLVQSPDVPGTAGTFHGYEGLAAVTAEILEAYEDLTWHPQRAFDLGDERYLVLLVAKARGRTSGVWLEAQIGHIVTIRDGRAERLETYLGWETALEAAGLPPGASASR